MLGDIVHGFWTAITTLPWWAGALFAVVVLSAIVRSVRAAIHGGHPRDAVRRFSQAERRMIFIRAGNRASIASRSSAAAAPQPASRPITCIRTAAAAGPRSATGKPCASDTTARSQRECLGTASSTTWRNDAPPTSSRATTPSSYAIDLPQPAPRSPLHPLSKSPFSRRPPLSQQRRIAGARCMFVVSATSSLYARSAAMNPVAGTRACGTACVAGQAVGLGDQERDCVPSPPGRAGWRPASPAQLVGLALTGLSLLEAFEETLGVGGDAQEVGDFL